MFPDSPAMREQDRLTAEAFAEPRPGDRFHEMFSAWVVVVSAGADGVKAMEGHGPVNLRRGRLTDGEIVEPFPERARVRWYATADDFRAAFRHGSIDGYTVMLADRGQLAEVGGWLDRATEVPAAPTHPKPPPAAAPDPLGDGLDAIEARNEHRIEAQKLTEASVARAAEGDVRRLLAAVRLMIGLYGAHVSQNDYAAVLAPLEGKEADSGR